MLRKILEKREDAIVEQWLDCILAAYPADGGAVFKRRTSQFANPVGYTAREAARTLLRTLRSEASAPSELAAPLADVLRIRAVQEMPPSDAVGFVLDLKGVVRAELESHRSADPAELRAFEDRVDRLALEAFDRYVAFREELARLKVKEARRHVSWIASRLNGTSSEGEPEAPGNDPGASDALPVVDHTRGRGGVS